MQGFDFTKYKRIMLVGSMGSGKSWLSKRIAEITGYPLVHLDVEYWLPDWQKPLKDKWIEKQQILIKGDEWIIDGNYESTMEVRFAAADLIIFLDVSRFISIWGAARRTGKKRSDLPEYLEEPKITSKVFLDICKYIWKFPKTGRKTVINLRGKYPDKAFLHIKSRREIKRLLG